VPSRAALEFESEESGAARDEENSTVTIAGALTRQTGRDRSPNGVALLIGLCHTLVEVECIALRRRAGTSRSNPTRKGSTGSGRRDLRFGWTRRDWFAGSGAC
jgi:hypothetical protein